MGERKPPLFYTIARGSIMAVTSHANAHTGYRGSYIDGGRTHVSTRECRGRYKTLEDAQAALASRASVDLAKQELADMRA